MLTVTYNAEHGFVESKLTGTVSPEDVQRKTVQAIATGQANDCYFFLSDLSEAELAFSAFEVYHLPKLQLETGLDRSAQIAIIAPESEQGRRIVDFYETVCFNRSWCAQVFENRQAALDWLLEQ